MKEKRLTGTVKRHPDGFGFLITDDPDHPDIYIGRKEMQGVMANDRLEVTVVPKKKGERFFGEDVAIVERSVTKIVGRLKKLTNGDCSIHDSFQKWGMLLVIPFKSSRSAVEDDLVAVEIISYPEDGDELVGRVIDIIGDSKDPLTDVKRVLHSQNIPVDFPYEALQEAKAFGDEVDEKDKADRIDLRDLPLITIDGVTAKDFDDAICVKNTDNGFILWVGIADVSHYVKPGASLDESAYDRGTSVYFPQYVVPMLPEELSNGLCSLKPEVDRLAFVCEMHIGFDGVVSKSKLYEAVMYSHARVTYGEAQDIIQGDSKHPKKEVNENIAAAADLAKILMRKRFNEGSLDLEIPETQVVIDETGLVTDIIKSSRVFAHKLIEELMLITNVSIARKFVEKEVPGIYRIHESPDSENIQGLQKFLQSFGIKKKLSGGSLQKKITDILRDHTGTPEGMVLSILTLRSMTQAKYSSNNVGHFGLGFEDYSHFTSPIRRYPDLIAHRLLKQLFLSKGKGVEMTEEAITSACTFLSACEQRSVKAERQFVAIKKARFMEKHLGEEYDGFISSVAKFGIFVLLREFDVDGLVKVDSLGNDFFDFNDELLQLVGKKTKKIYKIGDSIKVQLAAVDTDEGKIDFVLAGEKHGTYSGPKKSGKNDKKRGKTKKHRGSAGKVRVSGRRSKNKA